MFLGAFKSFRSPAAPKPFEKPESFGTSQEKKIREAFSRQRQSLKGKENVARDVMETDLGRFAAVSGVGRGSGAIQKARMTGQENLAEQFAGAANELGAQEEQTVAATLEAEKARQQQESQFTRTEALQRRQLDLAFKEFGLSQRATVINAAVALKEAGLRDPKAWEELLAEDSLFSQIFGRFSMPTGADRDPKSVKDYLLT